MSQDPQGPESIRNLGPGMFRWHIFEAFARDGKLIALMFDDRTTGKTYAVCDLVLQEVERWSLMRDELAVPMTDDGLSALAAELARVGVGLPGEAEAAGALPATERHLEDMREMAFSLLGVAKPPAAKDAGG